MLTVPFHLVTSINFGYVVAVCAYVVYMYACTCQCICACMYVCVHVYMCVYMYAHVCVCVCVRIYGIQYKLSTQQLIPASYSMHAFYEGVTNMCLFYTCTNCLVDFT